MKPISRRSFLTAFGVIPAVLATQLPTKNARGSVGSQVFARTPTISGYQLSGSSSFLATASLHGVDISRLTSVGFSITPKSGSTTTPISATYTKANLVARSLIDSNTQVITVPIYGLYASSRTTTNQVQIFVTVNGVVTTIPLTIVTNAWSDDGGAYSNPDVTTARDNSIELGFSYFMMKEWVMGRSPVVLDTDGEVRWYGTISGSGTQASTFFQDGFYLALGTQLWRNELDGTSTLVRDYSGVSVPGAGSVNYIQHHNIDFGQHGLLLEVNTDQYLESTILEVDTSGAILNTFSLSEIIANAMTSGGDNPGDFIPSPGTGNDWFHNNAACYWPEQNALIVSSREDFVIAVDYTTKAIKWILGDIQKQWYQFASLRAFALNPTPGTVTPIGQHALSVQNNQLMLFDDGFQSFAHNPSGNSRGVSVCRKYAVDPVAMTVSETWTFNHEPPIWSSICSSVYQVGESYLVDYANNGSGPILVGLGADNAIGFEYRYPLNYAGGWNALPINLSSLTFS